MCKLPYKLAKFAVYCAYKSFTATFRIKGLFLLRRVMCSRNNCCTGVGSLRVDRSHVRAKKTGVHSRQPYSSEVERAKANLKSFQA
ncbi:hypothetical protein Mapa_000032 [Marchantia paleacea]|nr:hypothetical protein Mapa_000032 [Marchantia paleacea]